MQKSMLKALVISARPVLKYFQPIEDCGLTFIITMVGVMHLLENYRYHIRRYLMGSYFQVISTEKSVRRSKSGLWKRTRIPGNVVNVRGPALRSTICWAIWKLIWTTLITVLSVAPLLEPGNHWGNTSELHIRNNYYICFCFCHW